MPENEAKYYLKNSEERTQRIHELHQLERLSLLRQVRYQALTIW